MLYCQTFTPIMGKQHLNGQRVQQLLGFLLLLCAVTCSGTSIGVSYDSKDGTLPSPKKLVELLRKHDLLHVRLLDANPIVLEALSGTEIEVAVGMRYKQVKDIGKSKSRAALWLKRNVMGFMPDTLITSIIVNHQGISEEVVSTLVSAMSAIHSALVDANLDKRIKVTTTLSSTLIQDASSVPPSSSTKDLRWVLHPLLAFVSKTGSFLILNTNFDRDFARSEEDLISSVVVAASNAMAFLHYPDIPIVVNDQGPPSEAMKTFLMTKNIRDQVLARSMNSAQIWTILVKMSSLDISLQEDLRKEGEEQFRSNSRELLDNKANSTRNKTSELGSQLDTFPTTPITTTPTTPITTTPTTPVTLTPPATTITPTTPTTPITTPTTPITTPTTPTITPYTPPTTPTTTPPTTSSGQGWCVAKSGISDSNLQVALDYACGLGGADCTAIQQGGMCYNPDTVSFHASYAFDSYYKKNGMAPGTCDFAGNAAVTAQDPSTGTCTFPSGTSSSSILNTSIPTSSGGLGVPPLSSSNSDATSIFFCVPVFFALFSLIVSMMVGERL